MPNDKTLVRCICHFCGEPFYAKRRDARFDGGKHRTAYYRWRKRLPYYQSKADWALREIADYLKFPDSRPYAVQILGILSHLIVELERSEGISRKK